MTVKELFYECEKYIRQRLADVPVVMLDPLEYANWMNSEKRDNVSTILTMV